VTEVLIKRIYEPAEAADGVRVLVDRLWPRGVSRERAALDGWWRELSPSHELRRWSGHDRGRFPEFRRRYEAEIAGRRDELGRALAAISGRERVTLLFAAADTVRNNAVVLRDVLLRELGPG
jgi:uncharacterized protein YeaO (DUF488 family)